MPYMKKKIPTLLNTNNSKIKTKDANSDRHLPCVMLKWVDLGETFKLQYIILKTWDANFDLVKWQYCIFTLPKNAAENIP